MALNFGDIVEAVARQRGDALAVSSEAGDLSWSEFDERSNALARALAEKGVRPGDKVAFLLFNSQAYLELLAACFKGRFVHANVNYRYTSGEVAYVVENSDAVALVYDARLQSVVDGLDDGLKQRLALIPTGEAYEAMIAAQDSAPLAITRSPQDQIFVYTGGTTGMPKGVIWTHNAQAHVLLAGTYGDRELNVDDIVAGLDQPKAYNCPLIASPLMHGLGLATALTTLCNGGHIVLTDNSGAFDAPLHWRLVEKHKADSIAIVGDAFAAPLLTALKAGDFDTSSVKVIGSSGVMWSTGLKRALLDHLPQATMFDSLASSEAMGIGNSVMRADGEVAVAKFTVGEHTKVFNEAGEEVARGTGETGMLARGGHLPEGYYKDAKKTAETFRIFGGNRYSVPGDMCSVDEDGTINLLGRGSQCINTGGEKVFPEEVETALKGHASVADALVFGLSDPKWGQAVSAVVCPADGCTIEEGELRDFLRSALAGYKIPKKVVFHGAELRLANGKPDYKAAKALFE